MVEKGRIVVGLDETVGTISPHIYGHFAEHLGRCIYPGIWVGEDSEIPNDGGLRRDVLEAFRRIHPPVVRWPGGCFADHYHWEDGVGPRDRRPGRVNLSWGGEESNEFGTDEFLRFCSLVGAEPYVCLNVGSGSPGEAYSWYEYCNWPGKTRYSGMRAGNGHPEPYGVRYWGVGNENWGCGGFFDPVYYAWEYRRFAGFLKRVEPAIQLVACGHTTEDWNLRLMEALRDHLRLVDHLSIHYYFRGYGGDVEFTDDDYYGLLGDIQNLDYHVQRAVEAVDLFAAQRREIGIIVDEWGVWHPQATRDAGLWQQNTLRDAILAASVLNLFNRHSARVVMANLAQTVNVLQSPFLTEGERLVLTPTYHVFDMYRAHMGNRAVRAEAESPTLREAPRRVPRPQLPQSRPKPLHALDVSASLGRGGRRLVLTVVNQHLGEELETEVTLRGGGEAEGGRAVVLTAKDVRNHNDFDAPGRVRPTEGEVEARGKTFVYTAPARSVNTLTIELR